MYALKFPEHYVILHAVEIQVDYKGTVTGISPGPAKIRCLLL